MNKGTSLLHPAERLTAEYESGKLIELEALRGIAALVVLVHHSLLAFFPRFHGLLEPESHNTLFGTPLFAAINGSAAVILFFVLSGFVLTLRTLQQRNYSTLIRTALKRWPRLMFPVLTVNLISGALAGWGLYNNSAIANSVGSEWLGWFFVDPPAGTSALRAAAYEGAVSTFFFGSNYFNSSLWTMRYEFYGSFFCLAIALFILLSRNYAPVIFLLVATVALWLMSPLFWPFFVGVGLAALHSSGQWSAIPLWLSRRGAVFWAIAVVLLFCLFGYHEALVPTSNPLGLYAFLMPLYEWNALATRVVIHTLASTVLVVLILSVPLVRNSLRTSWGAWLGRMSFPIYLVQVSVICSIASAVYMSTLNLGGLSASMLAFITAIVGSIAVAFPLMKLEILWLIGLRRIFGR